MTEIASHRGGAGLWPENTERAFRETAKLPVEQIEFDVQLSRDGVPVIFHDVTLDRMTNGTGPLADATLAELKALDVRGGERILTLDEGLDLLAPTHLTLRCEIKPGPDLVPYPGIIRKVLDALAARELTDRCIVTSFHLPTLADVVSMQEPLRGLIWLVADPVLRLTSARHVALLTKDAGVDHVALRCTSISRDVLTALRRADLRVGAFAAHDEIAIINALSLNLSEFTTDHPDLALTVRARTCS